MRRAPQSLEVTKTRVVNILRERGRPLIATSLVRMGAGGYDKVLQALRELEAERTIEAAGKIRKRGAPMSYRLAGAAGETERTKTECPRP